MAASYIGNTVVDTAAKLLHEKSFALIFSKGFNSISASLNHVTAVLRIFVYIKNLKENETNNDKKLKLIIKQIIPEIDIHQYFVSAVAEDSSSLVLEPYRSTGHNL